MLVNISSIKVNRRVRRDLGDLEPLKDSMRTYGLMNPITLNGRYELIAGERRLEAARELGWTSISAVIMDNLSPAEQLEMEIEENNQRKEFTNEELLEGYRRLERLRNPCFFMRVLNAVRRFFAAVAEAFRRWKKRRRTAARRRSDGPPERTRLPD